MIAVVYSGSRFAYWRLANRGKIVAGFSTSGLNPNLHDDRFINQTLHKSNPLINHAEAIKRIYFFGAGTSSPERKEKLHHSFSQFFKNAKIFIEEDIKASALATLGDNKGIMGILGSGSNAAYYNGKKIFAGNYGLGYILADEGSSNWLGRKLLKSYLTETMPADLKEAFTIKHSLDRKQIMDKIYMQPHPNLFLTSFADFVQEHQQHPFVDGLLRKGFHLYISTYLVPLHEQYPAFPINFTGTVAGNYEPLLRTIATGYGLQIDQVVREPIHNLLHYFINKN